MLKYCRETVVESTACLPPAGAVSGQQTLPIAARERMMLERCSNAGTSGFAAWSACSTLRSPCFSPAAAAATLRNRSVTRVEKPEAIDEEGRETVLDLDDQSAEGLDVAQAASRNPTVRVRRASTPACAANGSEALRGGEDASCAGAEELVQGLLEEGYAPILFCRFIPTVEYVAEALRAQTEGRRSRGGHYWRAAARRARAPRRRTLVITTGASSSAPTACLRAASTCSIASTPSSTTT